MIVKPEKRQKHNYKFVTNEDLVYYTSLLGKSFENEWLSIKPDGDVVVKGSNSNGYAWDGCTPKLNILDLILIGVPDGRVIASTNKPFTYYASLIHDILLQFRLESGIKRKEADQVFLEYLGEFKLRYLYYLSVRGYGAILDLFPEK